MKKYLFSSILLLAVLSVQAQLVVNQNGDISMKGSLWSGFSASLVTGEHKNMYIRNQGYTGNSWATALEIDAAPISEKWGVGVQGTAYNSTQNGTAGRNFGVLGRAGKATSGYNYGVYGQLLSTTNGAAVFGTISETAFGDILSMKYAGYFQGPVHVTGQLNVCAGITGTFLGYSSNNSRAIQTCTQKTEQVSDLLQGLSANAFYQEKTIRQEVYSGDTIATSPELSAMQQQIEKKIHYGLSADQMEAVFPELVYETENGEKAINYMELVPILVQAINELSAKVEELESGETSWRKTKMATDLSSVDENVMLLSLGQNKPNPFGKTTSIAVSVPEEVKTAFLYVYNLNGNKVAQVDITARGESSISFSASNLSDGMYLYSLIADGKVVETRRMIVEK